MAAIPYLVTRGNRFHFYRRVPTDLVGILGCIYWRESLRTDSRLIAQQRAADRTHHTNLLIEQARRGELRLLPDDVLEQHAMGWGRYY